MPELFWRRPDTIAAEMPFGLPLVKGGELLSAEDMSACAEGMAIARVGEDDLVSAAGASEDAGEEVAVFARPFLDVLFDTVDVLPAGAVGVVVAGTDMVG